MTPQTQKILFAYFELTKPRILFMVLLTTAMGYFLGAAKAWSWATALYLLVGTAGVCAGAAALNHYLERDVDQKMQRTRNRPLPAGIIPPNNAMLWGITLILSGVFLLYWKVNLLTSFLSLLTAFLYVLVYTPLKRLTWLNTTIGAIPGALPPLGGWAAATGDLSAGGWVLFLILFIWQHPHFYSIAWMFREDYERGGFKMLPVVDPDGKSTFRQINVFAILMLLTAIFPFIIGMSGEIYLASAIILSILFFISGLKLSATKAHSDAHQLLQNSVIYLPALLILILLDAKF
ncbi:MAG: protoheme IX farnesyltransferase [Candidatus Omnitrophica bacterium]|nr:protoheme IX farnesyltransferase [Candidatus Omnitrophota bacterium]